MKRVLKLIIIGLIPASIVWCFLFWKGGLGQALRVGITVNIKVKSNGTATRNIQICGPPIFVEHMPMLLGVEKDKWDEIQNYDEPGKLTLEINENISGEDTSWNLSTVKIQSSRGLIHRTVSYTEILSIEKVFKDPNSSENTSENSGDIADEFKSAWDETKRRAMKAAIAFARSVPISITIKMPGNIIESSTFKHKSRNVAYFQGKYKDFEKVGELRIVSKSLTPVCGRGGVLLIVIVPLGIIGYYLYRRFTFWAALRGESNGLCI